VVASIGEWFAFDNLFAFCDLHASRFAPGGLVTEGWQDVVLGATYYPRYFDRQGFPIPSDGENGPTLVWAQMMAADPLIRNVAQSDFPDGSLLSTVWLGLDHAFGGRPLFFETMYFSGAVETMTLPGGGEQDFRPTLEFPDPCGEQDEMIEQLRYGSEEEALAAHREITRRLRKRWEV
jgi:hypothetical protein